MEKSTLKKMDKNTLKGYFLTGKRPTEEQFAALIDSLFHIDDKIKISNVKNLCVILDSLEARKVNIYRERTIVIEPQNTPKYAKILSVKSGSFVLDFEVNEYPNNCRGNADWAINCISGKYNDCLMISTDNKESKAYTFRTKDIVYNTSPNGGYTDVYIKADILLLKTISLRLSFSTNDAEDAIIYYKNPEYVTWNQIPGTPAIVNTCGGGIIKVTYTELKELHKTGRLQPGVSYLIADFQTIYLQQVTNDHRMGEIEQIGRAHV